VEASAGFLAGPARLLPAKDSSPGDENFIANKQLL